MKRSTGCEHFGLEVGVVLVVPAHEEDVVLGEHAVAQLHQEFVVLHHAAEELAAEDLNILFTV